MNKKLGLAVAGAVMAFASTANAGITIPAGDWTLDIGGNVNAYFTSRDVKVTEKESGVKTDRTTLRQNGDYVEDSNTIGTGLLPAVVSIGAKTRQNDLDIAFNFAFWTGTSSGAGNSVYGRQGGALSGNELNIRQAYMTFGDKSWGEIKMGRDLGIFAADAILSDMTLLGVGLGAPGGSSTLGRIGSGYIYADWKGQIAYTSPNWNGFQFTAGVTEPWTNGNAGATKKDPGFEAKASYDWTGDVSGRVWTSAISQKHDGNNIAGESVKFDLDSYNGTVATSSVVYTPATTRNTFDSYTSRGWDVGTKVNVGPVALTGYYYDGRGLDSQNSAIAGGLQFLGGQKTKDDGGYVQAMWTTPIGTKLGASWGQSNSRSKSRNPAIDSDNFDIENESWMIGAYHPLTKSLNLVLEYADQQIKANGKNTDGTKDTWKVDAKSISAGAILFF